MDDKAENSLQSNVRTGYALGWSFTPLNMALTPPPDGFIGPMPLNSAGKRPLSGKWQAAPRESLETALRWAAAGNVGLRTGAASGGLLVIDLDVAKPEYSEAIVKALALPLTITAVTGGGGYHLYFQIPAGLALGNTSGKLAPAVDTRGDGGQVVYPGSVHLGTGRPYGWMHGRSPADVGVAALPANVLSILQAPKQNFPRLAQPAAAAPGQPAATSPAAGIPGQPPADATRQERYGNAAIARQMAAVSAAPAGGRGTALNAAAFALGQLVGGGVLTADQVMNGLLACCVANGLVAKDGRADVEYHIQHSLDAGIADPRGLPPPTAAQGGVAKNPGTTNHNAAGGGTHIVHNGDGPCPLGARDPKSGRLVLSTSRTLPTADAYVREFATHPGGRTLHCHAGRLVTWKNNRYVEMEDGAVCNRLHSWLHQAGAYDRNSNIAPFPANPSTVTSALDTIKTAVHVDQGRDAPFWISDDTPDPTPPPKEILPCLSANLHIPSGTIIPATPDLFCMNALDFDFNRDAQPPREWLKFLAQLWPTDPASILLLQEWFGYCLTADTSRQKMLLLVGPPRSGKGTIADILAALVGIGNVAGPTTDSLGDVFGLQQLIGKSLAVVSDARFSGNNLQTVFERLLVISGEGILTIRRMYLPHVTLRLNTRFVFLTNVVPRLTDSSGALANRFLLLSLVNSFLGREDLGLMDRLRSELPGILLWALQGWGRLQSRGRFVVPESSMESETLMADLGSPVSEFVRERCIVGPGENVTIDALFAAWREWCENEGRDKPGSRQGFGREIKAAFPGIRCRRNHASGRFYEGLGLRNPMAGDAPVPVPQDVPRDTASNGPDVVPTE